VRARGGARRSSAGLPGLAPAGARLGVPAVPARAAVLAVMAGAAVAAAPLGVGLAAVLDAVGGEADVGPNAHRLVVGRGGSSDGPAAGPSGRAHRSASCCSRSWRVRRTPRARQITHGASGVHPSGHSSLSGPGPEESASGITR